MARDLTQVLPRAPMSKALQVAIFRRDGWLCRWCNKPVIFPPALKYLEIEVKKLGNISPLSYHNKNWRRADAPLLDLLGAEIDHIDAHSGGGGSDQKNLVTACHKCNLRKGAKHLAKWNERSKERPIKSKYGEPKHWDGLSGVFVMLAHRNQARLTAGERAWIKALSPFIPTTSA